MYVVYSFSKTEYMKTFSGVAYGREKVAEFRTLDEANEKLKELNAKHEKIFYTIIIEP